jgi:hypothetical protein
MSCSLEATTSGGNLDCQMTKVGKYLRLHASGGDIDLEIPAKQGLDLNLTADHIDESILSGFTGDWQKRHVNGSVNGGGVPVDAHANGNLDVRYN